MNGEPGFAPSLVVLAAGLSTRYGRLKQLDPVGPSGETLIDYAILDAVRAGFGPIVIVIRPELQPAFEAHLTARFRGAVATTFARQSASPVPSDGAEGGCGRRWGTAEAVLAAGAVLDRPFTVVNADDFYGRTAYRRLADHLRAPGATSATVVYPLLETLSPSGGVSRAVCEIDESGRLVRITELLQIRLAGGAIRGVTTDGDARPLRGDELVSTNIWGFTPSMLPALQARSTAFADRHGGDEPAEFRLSMAVDALLSDGEIEVAALPTQDEWLGITHPDDRAWVVERLRAMTDAGLYPPDFGAAAAGWLGTGV